MIGATARTSVALLVLAVAFPAQAQTPPPSVPWNVLIYAAIDNDAEVDGNFFALEYSTNATSLEPHREVLHPTRPARRPPRTAGAPGRTDARA